MSILSKNEKKPNKWLEKPEITEERRNTEYKHVRENIWRQIQKHREDGGIDILENGSSQMDFISNQIKEESKRQ